MNPGRGTFEDVLDRLGQERADAALPGSGFWARIRGLNASFVGPTSKPDTQQDSERVHAAYYDHAGAVVAPPPPPPVPAVDVSMFKRLGPEDIASDINLLASDTRTDLQNKRRAFARTNHPDRAPEEWRDAATIRMKVANRLVDDALRKISLQRS
ncbi:hypothetical protein PZ897_16080 [Hoeflea sp. YIM 152468]|uniref:hypothetical protein n=1 Tax=Hoeflea sp. YIM 152468 TaxID=3031759 RepID=UPI0023D9BC92|nr:hypothetical protein [Hoeflea sp. YIM 152468]MDF1609706.1 hypothetical protein [Hoeflea sp. YIM 152468]